ncbi:MAG: FprA family A-type flavoprotein [Lentisphaeria bacterium]|nr:FprA family A-type flavoprotein [Lentisphaeria bacterium]
MKAFPVAENVWWVGVVDWSVRNFHGYETNRGTTYNAFLIIDEKITLIDTVKAPFFAEMRDRIASVIDPEKIDYIVSNHAEPDHSGALPAAVAAFKPEKVFASTAGVAALEAYYGKGMPLEPVRTGESLSLGRNTLHFVETKMLHWPDSMLSYLDGSKVLFSQDALGMHYATSYLWADQCDRKIMEYEAKKYIANILLHLSNKVIATLDLLPGLGLDIDVIAPDHGPLWRTPEDQQWIIDLYYRTAQQPWGKKALIVYHSMWGSTAAMAKELMDGFREAGIEADLVSLDVEERSSVATRVLDAGVVAVGSPTINNQMFPAVADVLCYLRGLKPQRHIGFAFGSFGWSGEGAKQVNQALTDMGFEMPLPVLAARYAPDAAVREQSFAAGVELGRLLKEKTTTKN